jgi:hypothetical protein
VENLNLERYVLKRGNIDLQIQNTGPDEIKIASVIVNNAVMPFEVTPSSTIPRLGRAQIHVNYAWTQGEAYGITVFTSNSIPFTVEIPVAFETPQPSSQTFWAFTLIGLYVGVIPIFLGIFWFPALRQLGRRAMTFLMAATAGLLLFLGLDTINEALEVAARVPSAFQGIGILGIGAVATFMLLAVEADGGRVVLTTRTTDSSVTMPYRGYQTRWEHSDIVGGRVPRYSTAAWDTVIPLYRESVPGITVLQPVGYLVPQEWDAARERLDLHGVRYQRFGRAWSDTVELQRIVEWEAETELREGHHPTQVKRVQLERRRRDMRPGDLWVPLDQPSAAVAVHLFEAQAPDGMMYWNFFDTVLERKEYAESYVMEPLARDMLRADTALAREFRQRLASDSTFANSPTARNDFFYRRSPWADPEHALHPVARALRRPPASVLTASDR